MAGDTEDIFTEESLDKIDEEREEDPMLQYNVSIVFFLLDIFKSLVASPWVMMLLLGDWVHF